MGIPQLLASGRSMRGLAVLLIAVAAVSLLVSMELSRRPGAHTRPWHFTSDQPHLRPGIKVVAFLIWGREPNFEIQDQYLRRNVRSNGGILDKVFFVYGPAGSKEYTKTADDAAVVALKSAAAEVPEYTPIPLEGAPSPTHTAYFPFWHASYTHSPELQDDPNVLWIKLDDDIVFIADGAFEAMVDEKLSNRNRCGVLSANVVNHTRISSLHQSLGVLHRDYISQQFSRPLDGFFMWSNHRELVGGTTIREFDLPLGEYVEHCTFACMDSAGCTGWVAGPVNFDNAEHNMHCTDTTPDLKDSVEKLMYGTMNDWEGKLRLEKHHRVRCWLKGDDKNTTLELSAQYTPCRHAERMDATHAEMYDRLTRRKGHEDDIRKQFANRKALQAFTKDESQISSPPVGFVAREPFSAGARYHTAFVYENEHDGPCSLKSADCSVNTHMNFIHSVMERVQNGARTMQDAVSSYTGFDVWRLHTPPDYRRYSINVVMLNGAEMKDYLVDHRLRSKNHKCSVDGVFDDEGCLSAIWPLETEALPHCVVGKAVVVHLSYGFQGGDNPPVYWLSYVRLRYKAMQKALFKAVTPWDWRSIWPVN